ncbi:hypothetical protein QYE76_014238 [Lolium multiflorum]|uniref:C2H2-type domain-containing protein n=1 Tax=Lolium multiflorum TaxID=4521 RepID=A0AAD8U256_LOLMU|nr:hypothetical protein QYE76_014238 [Lolium multiflorum]
MATGTDADGLSPSSGRRPCSELELEKGEFVASDDDLAGSHDDRRSVFQHHRGGGGKDARTRPEIKRRRLEFEGTVVDGGALPSPTPSCDCDSDGTISDVDADAGAASLAQEPLFFRCLVCRREFTSQKGLNGHMSAHGRRGRQHGNKERTPPRPRSAPVSVGWAVTGKRGSVGRRSVTPKKEALVDSMAMVVPEPVINPMPIAFASRSSSAEPNPRNPSNQVVVHPPCSPQFLRGHQPAAPQVVLALAQPTVIQAQQSVVKQPAAPQAVAHHVQRTTPPTPARDEQGWWLCKEKGCDQRRFATHRALGGHMSSHMRQKNYGGDPACANPAKLHPCKHCPREFTSPLQLGGHMSKHREKARSKKHGAIPKVLAHEIAPALALSLPMPPAAMEVAPAQPAVAPGVPGVLRLFGVNIVPAAPPACRRDRNGSELPQRAVDYSR